MIWALLLFVELPGFSISMKNLLVFCCSVSMMPLAYLFSRILRIDFRHSSNPLSTLGLIMSVNQILYLLIAVWIFAAVPD